MENVLSLPLLEEIPTNLLIILAFLRRDTFLLSLYQYGILSVTVLIISDLMLHNPSAP